MGHHPAAPPRNLPTVPACHGAAEPPTAITIAWAPLLPPAQSLSCTP